VVTAQDPFWRGLLAWLVARRAGAKLNVQVHTDLDAQPFPRRMLARIVLRRADSVRVVSEKVKKQVLAMRATASIHVLPIYVDMSRFSSIKPVPHEQKTILWVGRFEKEKDPLRAIGVLKEIQIRGIDAKLVMLGEGSLAQSIRACAKGMSVELPGWKDPAEFLPTADVVLCTSRHESWGASIVEALASGVSVVAPDVGIAKEAGAIIATHDDFAEKVIGVLRSGARGELKLSLHGKDEWAKRWKQTLL
jgi:glycosyltransferase involved in cell wall biosynthesis